MTRKTLGEFDAHTVAPETTIWLKGCKSEDLSTFIDILVSRGLDMVYVGPGDRYKVVQGK